MSPIKNDVDKPYEEITCLYNELSYMQSEIDCYQTKEISYNNTSIINKLKFRNFIICKGVNMRIKNCLKSAIHNCSSPNKVKITSGLRPQCTSSQHSKGEAIDVSWKAGGPLFLE
jgi:hypothetical protein